MSDDGFREIQHLNQLPTDLQQKPEDERSQSYSVLFSSFF